MLLKQLVLDFQFLDLRLLFLDLELELAVLFILSKRLPVVVHGDFLVVFLLSLLEHLVKVVFPKT